MRSRQTRKFLSTTLGLIVLGSLWFWFAPAPLGGSTSYVVTDGVSMEPRFHTGDLAVVRSQSSYHVGEIVAYHNKMLGTIVLHRIIGHAGARYIFKGDNNNFIDFEHPVARQLVGALWLHIPGVGATLRSIHSPALIGVLFALGVLILTGAAFTRRRRLRRRERRAGGSAPPPPRRLPPRLAGTAAGVLAVGLLALLPFVVLALLAFTRSSTELRPYKVPYQQSGTLSYSAAATPGPAYPGDRAVTGDPLFTHLVKAVDLRFRYRLHAAAGHSLTGRVSLDATVASTNGWQTTLALAPPTRFRGDRALVTGTLDLTSLLARLRSVEATTKVGGGSYTLTLVPHVSATGSVGGAPVHATFAPEVRFTLSPLEAQPVVSAAAGSPAGGQPPAGPFAPSAYGSATGSRPEPSSLTLGVARLSVATARTVALWGIAIVVGVLLATLASLRLTVRFLAPRARDESAAIRAKYGRFIVPVARVWQLPGVPVIDVTDMEALVQIAAHYDRSILYEKAQEGEAFWVTDESGQFRYALGAWASAAAAEPVQESAVDTLVNDVYDDELELGGAIAAYGARSPGESEADEWAEQGDWTPPRRSGRSHAGRPRVV